MKTDLFAKCHLNQGNFADVIICRLIPTAAHSEDDIDKTLEAFKQVKERLKLTL